MNVLIASSCMSPLFINKGGAVGTLIESIVEQNEKNKKFVLTLVLRYNKDTKEKIKKYKNTKFVFIKEPKVFELLNTITEFIYTKVQHKPYKAPKKYLWKMYVLVKLKKILLKENFNKIIFENNGYLLKTLQNKRISEKYKGNVFFHVHNDIPNNISSQCLKKCKILLISEYLMKKIINKCGESIKEQIYILKNGIDINLFTKELTIDEVKAMKKELRIDSNKRIILYTGRMVKEKGIEKLLEAYKKLKNKNKYILVFVGPYNFGEKQKYKVDLKIQSEINDIEDNIRFTGYVSHEEIWKYYKIANVAVLPSIWEEPAGLTMVEANLSQTPLITTNSGGIPEYIDDRYSIVLERNEKLSENIARSIELVCDNEEEWKGKTVSAYKLAKEKYSEEQYFNNLFEIIH